MRYSRLRLRLAGWFALGMLLGLTLLDVSLYHTIRRRDEAKLTAEVRTDSHGLRESVARELTEVPGTPLREAAQEALNEWPPSPVGLAVFSPDGELLARRGPARLTSAMPSFDSLPSGTATLDIPTVDGGGARIGADRGLKAGGFVVAAIQSTAGLHEDLEALVWWLVISVPLVLLISLPAGYYLARRALAPFRSMAQALEAIRPGALEGRLPLGSPPDELDRLAEQVNHLLNRLDAAGRQTQRFLAQAAHQLRTPLTLIRGESSLAIDRPRAAEDYRAALSRVSRAADQMSRRVDELFLLARAEAGERVPQTELVELDLVALEAADLMRGRAQSLGHRLELGQMDGAEVMGDAALLREAVLELLENACRHGETGAPIVIQVQSAPDSAALRVESPGPPVETDASASDQNGEGLGIAIVQWIAAAHGGTLEYARASDANRFSLVLRPVASDHVVLRG
jgi:signal transduction histidine kinase